jgi:hypothetical protein
MAGSEYLPDIRISIGPTEQADDIVVMIDILAAARAETRRREQFPILPGREGPEIRESDYRFAATIWCIFARPLKPPEYQSGVLEIRESYIGIAKDNVLRRVLRRSFMPALLEAANEGIAINMGVHNLFSASPSNRFER